MRWSIIGTANFLICTDPGSGRGGLRHVHSLCNYALPLAGPAVLVGAVAGGVALYRTRGKQLLAILAGPLAIAIVAAAAHRYPFDGARLTLFLSGSMLLLAVIGFEWIFSQAPLRLRKATLALPAYVLITALITAAIHIVHPRNRGHMRPLAEHLARQVRSDDALFVLEQCEFECYWNSDDPRLHWSLPRADAITARRFWIVWSFSNTRAASRREAILQWARKFARQRELFDLRDAQAVLFESTGAPIAPRDNQPPDVAGVPHDAHRD